MLAELSIKNFALIDELALTFGPGLNVMTGETGAGKSIIVGAINLILGGRASSDMVREGRDEADVQARFVSTDPDALRQRLEELGLPGDGEAIIRRVLLKTGRNRIYINGALASLTQLNSLGSDLITISGQHEHQQLLNPDNQLLILDQYGGLGELRAQTGRAYEELIRLKGEVARLERRIREARQEADLVEFQVREIEAAALTVGEDEELEQERHLARNAEKVFGLIKSGYDRLYGEAGSVIETLDGVRSDVERAAAFDERLTPLVKQIEGAYLELDDAARSLGDRLEAVVFDPERLEQIEERLALINRLKRKYGHSVRDILDFGGQAAERLDQVEETSRRLEDVRQELDRVRGELRDLAGSLSEQRRTVAETMARAVTRELRSLGMPSLEFDIPVQVVSKEDDPGPTGWDAVEFMISPNLGEPLKPLARIASGGELSRAMLGLKSLLAGRDRIQTIVFDEVDAGIGGGVAEVVGQKMKALARYHQILSITHLPQIAVYGQDHQLIYKEVRGGRTVTDMRTLAPEERVEEVARMLGGAALTDKTKAAAQELIVRADAG